MKFKEIKRYISAIDRVSICMYETLRYENYRFIRRVPDKYDEYYVYGIGLIESEFEIEEDSVTAEVEGNEIGKGYFLSKCIEIMLSEKPRKNVSL